MASTYLVGSAATPKDVVRLRIGDTTGPAWLFGPPTLCPGDGDYIRTGLKMRTPPEPVPIPTGP